MVRDFESKRAFTEIHPFRRYLGENDILIKKDAVGNTEILLKEQEIVIFESACHLTFRFRSRPVFLSHVVDVFRPPRELTKSLHGIRFTIFSYFWHGLPHRKMEWDIKREPIWPYCRSAAVMRTAV